MEKDFEALLASWKPVAYAMNELDRSIGLGDAYPFELSPRRPEQASFRAHGHPKFSRCCISGDTGLGLPNIFGNHARSF
jgi:hypothetical protein